MVNNVRDAEHREAPTANSDTRGWRAFLRKSYGIPILVFLFLRLDDASFFLWGAINKAPWNAWGCALPGQAGYSSFAPGFCVRTTLQVEAQHLPLGAGNILTQFVLPNITPFEWFQFSLELALAIALGLGILTRLFALVGTLWAAFIMSTYVWVPAEVFPDSLLFILVPLILVTIAGGSLLTVDHFLRPRLERRGRLARRVARWLMF